MSPRPEAVAAANWWAAKLTSPVQHDTGAAQSTALANAVSALARRQRTQAQIEAFREALAEEIEVHIDESAWDPAQPEFGSYVRTIALDYGPHEVLVDAAKKVGIELGTLDLPMKTVMWINPGVVKVAEGHSAQPVVIWRADA